MCDVFVPGYVCRHFPVCGYKDLTLEKNQYKLLQPAQLLFIFEARTIQGHPVMKRLRKLMHSTHDVHNVCVTVLEWQNTLGLQHVDKAMYSRADVPCSNASC